MRVYHFLNQEFAISNLALKRIKVARITELNDPFEFLPDASTIPIEKNSREDLQHRFNKQYGLLCFSKTWRSPLMWGHYADKHQGVALGFEISESDLIEVTYAPAPPKLSFNSLGWVEDIDNVAAQLISTKAESWRYEEEWRKLIALTSEEVEEKIVFRDFSEKLLLCEVIIGMNCNLTERQLGRILGGYPASIEVHGVCKHASKYEMTKS